MRIRLNALKIANKKIKNTDFSKIRNIHLIKNSHLGHCNFEASTIRDLKIRNSHFVSIQMGKSKINGLKIDHSDCSQTNWELSSLERSVWFRSNFSRANLQCTFWRHSTIKESRLVKADLRWANLSDSLFLRSNLKDADFCDANLSNVRFVDCNLTGARFNFNTILPFDREKAFKMGMIEVRPDFALNS